MWPEVGLHQPVWGCGGGGATYEVKPSTQMFFQMFLLWKSSRKDRWGREEGEEEGEKEEEACSVSSSATDDTVNQAVNILNLNKVTG